MPLTKVPERRTSYEEKLRTLLDGPMQIDAMQARIDTLHTLIDAAVQNDPHKLYSYEMYLENQENDVEFELGEGKPVKRTAVGLMRLVRDRRASIKSQLTKAP